MATQHLYPEVIRLQELRLKHFRAFESSRLVLDTMTLLVGRNGSGKSTLMEAFDFLRDATTDSLVNALERRGGLQGIRQRQTGPSARFDVSVAVVVRVKSDRVLYGFRLGARRGGSGFVVKEEVLRSVGAWFVRTERNFESSVVDLSPAVDPEGLILPLIAAQDSSRTWRAVLWALRNCRTYTLSPEAIGDEVKIGSSKWLERSGTNAGDVLKHLQGRQDAMSWIVAHLSAITPGIRGVRAEAAVARRRIRFEQESANGSLLPFWAHEVSDGTLRSLGVLLALRQEPRPLLVFIDEIEDSLHPAAQGVLMDALLSSTDRCQVVATTHSPEAASHPGVTGDRVRIVEWRAGRSDVYPLKDAAKALLTPPQSVGRLLRSNALWPDDVPALAPEDFWEPEA